ncbi:PREDICTED: ribonuclease 3-like [Camelina sativa]|nr:PREDICTED: ribonuclease 3-like [Camelina sativa]
MKKNWPTLSCPSNEGFKFWKHEWEKHGTCAESVMDQHEYFEAALKLKDKANLLQTLTNAEINPDDGFYDLKKITKAIKDGIGFTPGLQCNKDRERNDQLYQIYICVDTSGTEFIECPVLPKGGKCPSKLQFAKF